MKPKKLEQALERIELQQKAVWWDNFMYFLWILGLFLFKSMGQYIIYFIAVFIFIQFFEGREYKQVEKKYEKEKQKNNRKRKA